MDRILFFTTVHKIDDVRIFYKEILSVHKKFPKVNYIVPCGLKVRFYKSEINIEPLPFPKNEIDRIFRLQLLSFFKIIKLRPDIIHFHDPELLFLVWFIQKLIHCKVIYDVHENIVASFDDKTYLPKIFKSILKKYFSRIEKYLIKSFNSVILAEESYQKYYNDKTVTILNYPILAKIDTKNIDFSDTLNFVYCGQITELRGINNILEIFLILKRKYNLDVHLHLIGNYYPKNLEQYVFEYCSNNGIAEYVTQYGWLNMEEVCKLLQKMQIGFSILAPINNHLNSLPTKILEYMMFGLPVIVSDFKIYDKYVTSPNTGIKVDYSNNEDSAGKIHELIKNHKSLSIMSTNGIKKVKDEWNWQTEEKKLLDLYSKLLDK